MVSGIICPLILFCTSGCVSFQGPNTRNDEQITLLKSVLATPHLQTCSPISSVWQIPAPVKNLQIVLDESKKVAVYEAIFRNGIKTIWQPLNDSYELNGDGFVLGQRGQNNLIDFSIQKDLFKNSWTTYRYKLGENELYYGAIEFLEKSNKKQKLSQIRIPTPSSDSVQQVWLLPSVSSGTATVVIRTNSILDSAEEKYESTYSWYTVIPKKNTIQKIAEYKDRTDNLSSLQFIPFGKNSEPLALGVLNSAADADAASAKSQKQTSKIIIKRIFTPRREESVLFQSPTPISNFIVRFKPTGADFNTIFAWIQEPEGQPYPQIAWSNAKFDYSEKGISQLFASTTLSNNRFKAPVIKGSANPIPANIISIMRPKIINTGHQPVQLQFRDISAGQKDDSGIALSWVAGMEGDFGYLTYQVYPPLRDDQKPLAFYSSDPTGQVIGTYEPSKHSANSILFVAKGPDSKNPHKPSQIRLCAFNLNY